METEVNGGKRTENISLQEADPKDNGKEETTRYIEKIEKEICFQYVVLTTQTYE